MHPWNMTAYQTRKRISGMAQIDGREDTDMAVEVDKSDE